MLQYLNQFKLSFIVRVPEPPNADVLRDVPRRHPALGRAVPEAGLPVRGGGRDRRRLHRRRAGVPRGHQVRQAGRAAPAHQGQRYLLASSSCPTYLVAN